jgi:capsule polysaccharide export protein KpsE/RkpR
MFKTAAWIEGYCEALTKLGWSPERVMQIKSMLSKEVPAARALHTKMTAQRSGLLQQSPRIQGMAQGVNMSPQEFSMMTLGQKAKPMRQVGTSPPTPQTARQVA